jgi:hypothetical protein
VGKKVKMKLYSVEEKGRRRMGQDLQHEYLQMRRRKKTPSVPKKVVGDIEIEGNKNYLVVDTVDRILIS